MATQQIKKRSHYTSTTTCSSNNATNTSINPPSSSSNTSNPYDDKSSSSSSSLSSSIMMMMSSFTRRKRIIIFLTIVGGVSIICCCCIGIIILLLGNGSNSNTGGNSRSTGIYKGTPWFNNERTISVRTIGETKFARCDIHTVRSEQKQKQNGLQSNNNNENGNNKNKNNNIITDWLFLEEMNAVNIAVRMFNNDEDGFNNQKLFPVFQQKKYAIPGTTFSPVGGFIDTNESPWDSAKREVFEELGVGSRKTKQQIIDFTTTQSKAERETEATVEVDTIRKAFASLPKTKLIIDDYNLAEGDIPHHHDTDTVDSDWIFLGRYRSAANRGAGFVYTYFLQNAVPLLPNGGTSHFLPTGDDEVQTIQVLTTNEIQQAVMEGQFQEVKWTTTYALSLLHLQSKTTNKQPSNHKN